MNNSKLIPMLPPPNQIHGDFTYEVRSMDQMTLPEVQMYSANHAAHKHITEILEKKPIGTCTVCRQYLYWFHNTVQCKGCRFSCHKKCHIILSSQHPFLCNTCVAPHYGPINHSKKA